MFVYQQMMSLSENVYDKGIDNLLVCIIITAISHHIMQLCLTFINIPVKVMLHTSRKVSLGSQEDKNI